MNMRISLLLTATLAAVTTLPPALEAQTFEGVVTFQVTAGPAGKQDIKYSVKGSKMRMDVSAQGMQMYNLMDASTKTFDMVVPMRQMYMERSMNSAQMQAMSDSAAAQAKVEWTGKKETILGHECEYAKVTPAQGPVTEVCVAKDLGRFVPMSMGARGRGGAMSEWEHQLGDGFPLKVMRDGEVMMVATSIEKKKLDDSLFTIPDGYRKMSMPGMGGGGGNR